MNNMKSLESAGTNPSLEKCINPDLWYACAGPLVSLPPVGSLVVYFPQGHIEQVAASMRKDNSVQIPSYPNLPSKLICILQNVTLHAYAETDEVYAQMTLQPVNTYGKEVLLASDVAPKTTRQQTEFFCKTLTASDTSTHGGFSVPRRAAEKIFPPLDFLKQPPAQELKARDLHDNEWIFRHIYRGQPKRHLLTTGWSLFVSAKRLLAGDSVLFIRDDKSQLLLGIRRANRQLANASSSVLSSDSMHFGILAAAAHASANNISFTVFFNPRASPSEFIIPLSKYNKAMFNSQISPGMRFRMMFETEDSGTRRYMGTITGVTDLDPIRWKNSLWKNLQVAWDESSAGERRDRVSIWDIEPVETPFFIFPPPFFRAKRPRLPEIPDDEATDSDNVFRKTFPWFMEDTFLKDPQAPNPIPALSLTQWMALQQNPSLNSPILPDSLPSMSSSTIQNLCQIDLSHQLGLQGKMLQQNNLQFNSSKQPIQSHTNHLSNLPISNNLLGTVMQSQPINELNQQPKKNLAGQTPLQSQTQIPILHQQISGETTLPQQPLLPNLHSQSNFSTQQQTHHQSQLQVQNIHMNSQMQVSEQQMQLQILQKIQQHPLLSPCNFSNSGNSTQSKLAHEGTVFSNPPANQPQQNQETILAEIIGSGLPYPPPSNLLSTPGVNLLPTGATQSGLAVNGESCYTSSSMSQCPVPSQPFACKPTCNGNLEEELVQSSDMILNKDLLKVDVKPLIRVVKTSGEGTSLQPYACAAQIDCLDSSSSVTSACLSQPDDNEDNVYQIDPFGQNYPQSFNKFSTPFREDNEVQANPRSGCVSDVNIDGQFDMPLLPDRLEKNIFSGKDFYQNPSSGNLFIKYSTNTKDDHQELSSSIVSQSHGVQDMEFNSTNSMANDGSFINRSLMTHPPFQPPRMRTFTKVYKRGAVGRSIDITRYSGYDELKQDLARRFSIEGQLEDQQRIGWKLVYVDHENDILLVGDDPWDEFVSCVRYIKILSPQEVQQMSFDEDLGNCIPNQACSSSDGGNACWGSCVGDVNPSIRSQAH